MDALLSPALGTIIWASIAFIIVLILLRKMAWGPILKGLKEREESIAGSLNELILRQTMNNYFKMLVMSVTNFLRKGVN
jgi:hypothetical protein